MPESATRQVVPRISRLISFLLLTAIGVFTLKVFWLGVPVSPQVNAWLVEAKLSFHAREGFNKVSFQIPPSAPNYEILTENFVSDGFKVAIVADGENRKLVWTRNSAQADYTLFYRAVIRPLKTITSPAEQVPKLEVPEFSAQEQSVVNQLLQTVKQSVTNERALVEILLKEVRRPSLELMVILLEGAAQNSSKLDFAQKLLAQAGIVSRQVQGLNLNRAERDIPLRTWLELYLDSNWIAFDFWRGSWEVSNNFLVWKRGTGSLLKTIGTSNRELSISVSPSDHFETGAEELSHIHTNYFPYLGLLPVEAQAAYRLILLLPLGALVVVVLRSLIGLKTFGTFMPVLVALAFRETQLLYGLLLFCTVVSLGLISRFFFEELKLLIVPRLAATLTVVIIIVLLLPMATRTLGISEGTTVALFPMVIMTMTIERMSIMWEELGGKAALKQGLASLFAASVAYVVISNAYLGYLFFVFPELLLVVLALTILTGRYTGYRLLELRRFRYFGEPT